MKKIFFLTILGALFLSVSAQEPWSTEGNAGTHHSTNFLGTTDGEPLIIKTDGEERMRFKSTGELGIGTFPNDPAAPLHLQVTTPPVTGNLFQIGAGVNGVNGKLVLKSGAARSMSLNYETEGVFSIDGFKGGIRLNPVGTVEVYQNLGKDVSPSPPPAFKVFGNAVFEKGVSALLLNVQTASITVRLWAKELTAPSASIDETLTAKALSAQSTNISGTLTTKVLNAQSADIGTLSANLISTPNANITGFLCANEIRVKRGGENCWPDFVFAKDYKLMPLPELENFINENSHLPNIPSSADVEANGIELGKMNALLLQKVEELTLYILQQNKKIEDLQNQMNELKNQ